MTPATSVSSSLPAPALARGQRDPVAHQQLVLRQDDDVREVQGHVQHRHDLGQARW